MKPSKLLTLLSALAISATATAATTDAVGFVSVTVPANSDAILAVPLNRAAEFKGVIQTIAGNVITVAGTPAWTANAFAPGVTANKTYAVQIASGAKEGLIGRVTANGVNTLTITLDSGEDLTGIGSVDVPVDPDGVGPLTAQADQLDIMPYWTPSSLFGTGLPSAGIEVNFISTADIGTNLAPNTIYELAGTNWLDQNTAAPVGHAPVSFGSAFIFRNGTGNAVPLSMVGSVPMAKHRTLVRTLAANTAQDNRIGYMSPIPQSIGSVALGTNPGDELHIFDNAATGMNKAPVQILEYIGSNSWLDQNTAQNVTNTFQLLPGQGYLLRRVGTASPSAVVWTSLPSYLNP